MNTATQTTPVVRMQSRVGKRPIPVPKGVKVDVNDRKVKVDGPKGKLAWDLPALVELTREGDLIKVSSSAPGRSAARLQGLTRALVASMVKGVAEGYTQTLELVGTGYRCELVGNTVKLLLGLSHVAVYQLPESVTGVIPADSKQTVLVLSSPNKALLGQAAASLRHLRPPEPYGGKGVRLRGEKVRHKAGKAGKGRTK